MGFGPMRQECKVLHEPPDCGRHFCWPDARLYLVGEGMYEENPYHFSSVLKSLHVKLDPRRFSIDPEMGAAIGCVLGASYGYFPAIEAITVVYDGTVLGQARGSKKTIWIGKYDDVVRRWKYLLAVSRLTPLEWMAAESRFAAKVGYVFDPLN